MSLQASGVLSASDAANAAYSVLQNFAPWRPPRGDPPHQLAFFDRLAALVTDEPAVLWACGDNAAGQTGIRPPSKVPVLALTRVEGVPLALHAAAGATHSLLVGADGHLYAAGADFIDGRLGLGSASEGTSPSYSGASAQQHVSSQSQMQQLIYELQQQQAGIASTQQNEQQSAPYNDAIAQISPNQATFTHEVIHVQQTAGPQELANDYSDLPPQIQLLQLQRKPIPYRKFTKVPLGGHVPVACAAGNKHSIVLTSTGVVLVAGDNSRGQLGFADRRDRAKFCPALLPREARRIVQVAAGSAHSVLLSENGAVYACGENRNAQLGLGSFVGSSLARFVEISLPELACYISAGDEHTLIIGASRRVAYGAGLNCTGQLGTGDRLDRVSFCALDCKLGTKDDIVSCPTGEDELIESASAGGSHSLLLTSWGRLFAAGECFVQGGASRRRSSFSPITGNVICASAGWSHSVAVRSSPSRLAVAGENRHGSLGTGDVVSRGRFWTSAIPSSPLLVAAGRGHTLVLAKTLSCE